MRQGYKMQMQRECQAPPESLRRRISVRNMNKPLCAPCMRCRPTEREPWEEVAPYDYPPPTGSPPRPSAPPRGPPGNGRGPGGGGDGGGVSNLTKALIAGAFIMGMGAGAAAGGSASRSPATQSPALYCTPPPVRLPCLGASHTEQNSATVRHVLLGRSHGAI